jgi:hypothetical protein
MFSFIDIISDSGNVWSCGEGKNGELGLGSHKTTSRLFKKVEFPTNVIPSGNSPMKIKDIISEYGQVVAVTGSFGVLSLNRVF